MSKPRISIKGKELQELCEIVVKYLHATSFDNLYKLALRYEIDLDSGDDITHSGEWYVYRLVYMVNDTDQLYDFLDYLVDQDRINHDEYDVILKKHGFTIEKFQDKYHLARLSGGILDEEIKEQQTYIEENAPQETLDCLRKAKEDFAKNAYNDALADCRASLESLTKHSFAEGIRELIREEVIGDGLEARKEEAWILRAIYGFNSTLGSHNSATNPVADEEEAYLGLLTTQASIRFLIKRIKEVRSGGKILQEWV